MHTWQSFGTMAGRLASWVKNAVFGPKTLYGKVTLLATIGSAVGLCLIFLAFFDVNVPKVSADNVSTSVTVLNTPPAWTIDAQEDNYDSATTTPTNAGDLVRWKATGTDSSADPYWLIICKNNAAPTPNINSAPTCSGGAVNQWAVSVGTTTGGGTTSGFSATAATTTKEGYPFSAEKNDWYGWICDGNSSLPQCNALVKQGVGTGGPSPFFVDHPPVFTSLSQTAPQNPGSNVVWTSAATTTDLVRGGDKVILYLCRTNSFLSASSSASCPGGLIAKSATTTINATSTLVLTIPYQDATYPAWAFLTNNFNLAATSTLQGSSSPYIVNNVAPTVANVVFLDPVHSSTTIVLAVPNGQTGPYWITSQVSDNNGCQNISTGNEIASMAASVYRNGSGQSSTTCRYNTAGDYNSNSCYTSASGNTNFVCTQDAGSCTAGTVSATWTCTVSLWYNADPTDGGSVYSGLKWAADVVATDDNGLPSPAVESSTGNSKTLTSFLAFAVTQTAIGFGGLQPGQQNDPLGNPSTTATTTIRELGNTGIDQSIYGDTMCPNWAGADSCDALNHFDVTKDIPIANQKVGTSSVAYASSFAYALGGSTTPTSVGIHVQKTTSTSSPNNKDSFFGINIPSAITVAGGYTGQDTIIAVTSASANW